MDFDKILEHLDGFGKYQKIVYFLSCLPPILVSMNMLSYVFNSAVPKHRCFIPHCDSNDTSYYEPWTNFTIPRDSLNNGQSSSCLLYAINTYGTNESCLPSNFNHSKSIPCKNWIYDDSMYKSTVVTEWNLICDHKEEAPLSGTIWMAGVIFGAAFFGYLSDRFGRRPTVMASILIMSITGFAIPFLPNYTIFLVIRFVQAASTSGVYQTLFVLGLEFVGASKRVLCGIGLNFTFALGEILLGIVAYFFRDWRQLQLILAIPCAFFLLYYWFIPESVRWLISQERFAEATNLINKIAKINKTSVPVQYLEQRDFCSDSSETIAEIPILKPKVSVLELFRRRKLRWRTLNIFLNWFMNTVGYYGISMNSTNLGGNEYLNFILTSLVELPAYVFCMLVLDRVGRKIPLAASMITGGAACICVMFVVDNPNMQWVALTLSLIGKFGCSAAFSIIYVFSAELFPTVLRNNGIGLSSFFAHIGGMLAPYIAYLAVYSKSLPLLISGCSLVASGILAFGLPETLHQKLPETVDDAEMFGSSFYPNDKDKSEHEALLTNQESHLE